VGLRAGLDTEAGGKIRGTISFGGEVKPSVPCRKILRHVKERRRLTAVTNAHIVHPPADI
jgi:hypothetical protein